MKIKINEVFRIIRPYWLSKDKWIGLAILALLLLMLVGGVKFQEWQSGFTKDLYDSVEKRDAAAFRSLSIMAVIVLLSYAAMSAAKGYFDQMLQIRWREGLTAYFLRRWFADRNFFRLERSQLVDNPDQRISEDVKLFVEHTMSLTFAFLSNAGMLYVFGPILWNIAGPITINVTSNLSWTIPGYLFWVAILYAVGQTLVTHYVGRRLIPLTVQQQKAEADFRHAMVQQRDYAEQLAFYNSGDVELSRLDRLFVEIKINFRQLMTRTKYLNFVNTSAIAIQSLIPVFAVAPKLMGGEMTVGSVLQSQGAFLAFCMSVGWFGLVYSQIVAWIAVTRRLVHLNRVLDPVPKTGVEIEQVAQKSISGRSLSLTLPDASPLFAISEFNFGPAEKWLIRGPSGAGKSTFLRALAGLWPYGSGHIQMPQGATLQFMPQRCYVPDGTLKAALAYPSSPQTYSDEESLRALSDCLLDQFSDQLHVAARWGQRLSPGEQQRLAFARVLLCAPDFVFADEATSALDIATEAHLMALVEQRLPHVALISVAHRTTLAAFHTHVLEFDGKGCAASSKIEVGTEK